MFNGVEPFKLIVNIPSAGDPMWNLVKISRAPLEKTMFKDYMLLYIYVAQWPGLIISGDKILTVTKKFYYFNYTV